MPPAVGRLLDAATHPTTPRARVLSKQLLYFGLLGVLSLAVEATGSALAHAPLYAGGLAVATGATALALTLPWHRLHPAWVTVIPVLDFVATGMCRHSVGTMLSGISLLCLVPAVWMVSLYGMRGVAAATALALIAIGLPTMFQRTEGSGLIGVIRGLLMPVAVLQLTLVVASTLDTARRATARARRETQARQALLDRAETQEAQLKTLVDSLEVGIVVVDRNGHDRLMNRVQGDNHRLALPAGAADGSEQELLLFHPGTDVPLAPDQRPVCRAVRGERFEGFAITMRPAAEPPRTFLTSAAQLTDTAGEPDGAVVSFTDVTALVEAERAQARFVSTVSHELRTPLTSIIGYLELIEDEDLPRDVRAQLDVVGRNSEQLLVLVEDLLQAGRLDSGRLHLKTAPTRLSELAEQACLSARSHAQSRGVALSTQIEPTPVTGLDPVRVAQVLDNLVSNALKYTPRGGRVCVSTQVGPATVDVVVTDSGIGMSTHEQSELFTRFFRAESVRSRNIPGFGLGLSIVRDIVRAHGGEITVHSVPDQGSTFRVSLPRGGPPAGSAVQPGVRQTQVAGDRR